jgi:hypothetical protein
MCCRHPRPIPLSLGLRNPCLSAQSSWTWSFARRHHRQLWKAGGSPPCDGGLQPLKAMESPPHLSFARVSLHYSSHSTAKIASPRSVGKPRKREDHSRGTGERRWLAFCRLLVLCHFFVLFPKKILSRADAVLHFHVLQVVLSSLWHDASLGIVWRQARRPITTCSRADDGNRLCLVVDKILPGSAERSAAVHVLFSFMAQGFHAIIP